MAVGGFDAVIDSVKDTYPARTLRVMANVDRPFTRILKSDLPAGSKADDAGVVRFQAYMASPQSIGQLNDGDDLPVPQDRTEKRFTLYPKLFAGTYQIGWITRRAANSGASAFDGGEVARKVEETISDVAKHIERTYVATHGTGRLAVVDNPSGDGTNLFVVRQPEGVQLLRVGMRISARTTDGGDSVSGSFDNQAITAIDVATRTVTYAGTDRTLTAGDHIHLVTKASQTNFDDTDINAVPSMGLRGIVDDATFVTTFQGLSRSTYPLLKSVVRGNGGTLRNLTEQILTNAANEVWHRSGKRVTHCVGSSGQGEKYAEFVSPDRRFPQQGGPSRYVTGHDEDSLVHVYPGGKFKFVQLPDAIPREIFLLSLDTFFHYEAQPLDWWDMGTGKMLPVPGTATYKAAFFAAVGSVENLGCDSPIASAVIRDLKDPLTGDV